MTAGALRLRHIAPAGAPIRLPDLARWTALALGGGEVEGRLTRMVRDRFGVRHAYLTSTGRAGMTLLLQALKTLAPDRTEVVLPSYTCFSVGASVVKAGLRPRLVDVSPETLDFDPRALADTDFRRVLAIIPTNLYGLPSDLPAISELASRHGVYTIDDAAQAMGASIDGRWSGTWGDAGLFSLDKGKNVSAIDGGVVVTNSDAVARAVERLTTELPAPRLAESTAGVIKALGYFAMLRPWLYWIPNRIPQLELGKTVFTTDYPLERPSRTLVALACVMLNRLDEFSQARVENARALLDRIEGVPGLEIVKASPQASPVYLRLPLLVRDPRQRAEALRRLNALGIGATGSYPASLIDVPALSSSGDQSRVPMAGGRRVAREILTLPTHAFMKPSDVATAGDTLRTVLKT